MITANNASGDGISCLTSFLPCGNLYHLLACRETYHYLAQYALILSAVSLICRPDIMSFFVVFTWHKPTGRCPQRRTTARSFKRWWKTAAISCLTLRLSGFYTLRLPAFSYYVVSFRIKVLRPKTLWAIRIYFSSGTIASVFPRKARTLRTSKRAARIRRCKTWF